MEAPGQLRIPSGLLVFPGKATGLRSTLVRLGKLREAETVGAGMQTRPSPARLPPGCGHDCRSGGAHLADRTQ